MASGWTNRGKYNLLATVFQGTTLPTTFYLALVKSTPTVDTNLMSELTEVATGNGYTTGGESIARSAVGFDVLTEDDTGDQAFVQLADVVYTASGGPLPSDSAGATYAVLTDDNVTVGSREVWAFFDLTSARVVSDGQSLTIQDAQLTGA